MIPSNNGKSPENPLSPSQLNKLAKNSIEDTLGSLWLTGEITDLYKAPSGHAYFAIKDQKSSIKCTFFKQFNFKNAVLKNGDNILAFGRATLYEERGTFQLKVERVETTGIGDMAKEFAQLKVKLEALGYFSHERKKQLPHKINSLAIITSTSSAAIKDVLDVIKRRNPLLNVTVYHASVQGDKAIEEIIDALLTADINQHDVILLTRGGGSEEDLWTFNDISIAQTLFNLNTPCVSAVGHERDTSISDLVADVSAITPTAAAELLTPDLAELKLKINHQLIILKNSIENKINRQQQQLDISYHKLEKSHPKNQINSEKQLLSSKQEKLIQGIKDRMTDCDKKISTSTNQLLRYNFNFEAIHNRLSIYNKDMGNLVMKRFESDCSHLNQSINGLNKLSPLSTLSRGYSISLNNNSKKVINNIDQVSIGSEIETVVLDGHIISTVKKINKKGLSD
ncbi:MAG: exodeoxyribonuclease VII large subunit [Marinicellaceae bacterium]